ncbi:fibronectin type III domain-containing protein [Nocardiopsis alba]|uniref:fibronectin type III domain-containing protein n=1 Tax=Nocardiopsis alba TaxID=53437 RepID=UPI00366F8F45
MVWDRGDRSEHERRVPTPARHDETPADPFVHYGIEDDLGERPREESRADLRARGVRVATRPPELPILPPLRDHRALGDHLRTCGALFSPVVVFGEERLSRGFTVLDGLRLREDGLPEESGCLTLDDEALDAAGRRLQREPMTEGKAAAERVIALLRSAGSREARDRIVLWEIVSHMSSPPPVVSERSLAEPWTAAGLDPAEASRIAAALRRGGRGAERTATAEQEVRALLADRCLRQAEAATAELPREHPLRSEVSDLTERVDSLVRDADLALREGRSEDAARDLAVAVDLAMDDERLPLRLGAIPPEPVQEVTARVDGRRVVVTWRPSTSTAGAVSYRVTRRTGSGGSARETPLGEVTGTEAVDDHLCVGGDAHYAVVAVRGGLGVSPEATSTPVMITPDVAEPRTVSDETGVTMSWRPPPEAIRIEVLRREGAPPHGSSPDTIVVEHDGSRFHDTSVRPDVEYFYRVRAVYLTSRGRTRTSQGRVVRVVPGPRAVPVRDLRVFPEPRGFTASWTPPERGRVRLFTERRAPSVPFGTEVDTGPEALPGAPVPGTPVIGADGRARLPLSLPAGITHVLAVTTAGESTVMGEHVRVTAAPPVTDLRAERFDTAVRLGWTWPEHTATALVSWRPDTPRESDLPTSAGEDRGVLGTERRSRRRYDAEGGFEARMGAGPLLVTVRTVVPTGDDETLSVPVTVRVPGRVVLDYRVEPAGLLRRERIVRLSSEVACRMPEIAVVYTPGRIQPHTGERGRVLSVLPARPLEPGERVSVRVRPPREAEPGWLMCFPVEGGEDVRLRQPPVKELRL